MVAVKITMMLMRMIRIQIVMMMMRRIEIVMMMTTMSLLGVTQTCVLVQTFRRLTLGATNAAQQTTPHSTRPRDWQRRENLLLSWFPFSNISYTLVPFLSRSVHVVPMRICSEQASGCTPPETCFFLTWTALMMGSKYMLYFGKHTKRALLGKLRTQRLYITVN